MKGSNAVYLVEYKSYPMKRELSSYFKILVSVYLAYASISCIQQDKFVKKLTNNKSQF
jgi:hypothetical protein